MSGSPGPRLAPARSFPAYRYLPGETPHPTRDPRGHSYAVAEPASPASCPPPDEWRRSEEYLYAIDLYNHGYFWEAHESWELLWRAAPETSAQHVFLQALIQAAAASLQRRLGAEAGARRLARRAAARLREVAAAAPSCMGVDVLAFERGLLSHFEADAAFPYLRVRD